ncbi:MAG: hypothetical protein A2385_06020 [Bdellovibrionales bacterium RIFOXYB1_FULL_39_21]|nr:MAG: hypothetical protein A2385_06020 [Bdellovibrionales bacterium RIFOXYB1_FULL_39_21]
MQTFFILDNLLPEIVLLSSILLTFFFTRKNKGSKIAAFINYFAIAIIALVLGQRLLLNYPAISLSESFFVIDRVGHAMKFLLIIFFAIFSVAQIEKWTARKQIFLLISFFTISANNLWMIVFLELFFLLDSLFSFEDKFFSWHRGEKIKIFLTMMASITLIFLLDGGNLTQVIQAKENSFSFIKPTMLALVLLFGRHIYIFPFINMENTNNDSKKWPFEDILIKISIFTFYLRILLNFKTLDLALPYMGIELSIVNLLIISIVMGGVLSLWERSLVRLGNFDNMFLVGGLLIINFISQGKYLAISSLGVALVAVTAKAIQLRVVSVFNNDHRERLVGMFKRFRYEVVGMMVSYLAILVFFEILLIQFRQRGALVFSWQRGIVFFALIIFIISKRQFLRDIIKGDSELISSLLISEKEDSAITASRMQNIIMAIYFFIGFVLAISINHDLMDVHFLGI